MDITSHKPKLIYRGEPLEEFDAIIPRIAASYTFYGTAVVRQFEMTGAYCLNNANAISNSRDKLLAHQLMAIKQCLQGGKAAIPDAIKGLDLGIDSLFPYTDFTR